MAIYRRLPNIAHGRKEELIIGFEDEKSEKSIEWKKGAHFLEALRSGRKPRSPQKKATFFRVSNPSQ